jgi:hypothetical protein
MVGHKRRGNGLGNDTRGRGSGGGVESLLNLADARQLADADIQGLKGILGGPLITIVVQSVEDLLYLHRACVALEDLDNGGSKRSGLRTGPGTTGQRRSGSIGIQLATGTGRTTAATGYLGGLE